MSNRNQANLYTEARSLIQGAGYDDLTDFQKRVLPFFFKPRDLVIDTSGQKGRTAAFILPIILRVTDNKEGIKAVILAPGADQAAKVYTVFKKLNHGRSLRGVLLSEKKDMRAEEGLLRQKRDIIIGTPPRLIDHIRRGNVGFTRLRTVAVQAFEEKLNPGFFEDILFVASKLPRSTQTIILTSRGGMNFWEKKSILKRPVLINKTDGTKLLYEWEKDKVSDDVAIMQSEENTAKKVIEDILKKIKEDEDPDELNLFRKTLRKHVPVFLRSYFAAYLFKQALGSVEKKPVALTTLFISIGKNRKVFPKDLVNLFMQDLNIKRSDIGAIKILDNYSFLDISLDYASEAISKLSGKPFRGRRITVNLARKKGETYRSAGSA